MTKSTLSIADDADLLAEPALRDGTDVLEGARAGREEAWAELYRRFGPALTRFAASRGVADPEDVAQEVMYAAASRLDDFSGGWEGFRSFLFTVAYRRCADHHRRRYRRPEDLTDSAADHLDPAPGADENLWEQAEAAEALTALDILEPRERDVVTLRVLGELGTAEVASTLGMSRVNVRVTQSRALTKLRRHLESNGGVLDRRFRSVPLSAAIALGEMGPLTRLRYMRETLPSDGPLGEWIENLRSITPPASAPSDLAQMSQVLAAEAVSSAATTSLGPGISQVAAFVVAGALVAGMAAGPSSAPDSPPPSGSATASPASAASEATEGSETATATRALGAPPATDPRTGTPASTLPVGTGRLSADPLSYGSALSDWAGALGPTSGELSLPLEAVESSVGGSLPEVDGDTVVRTTIDVTDASESAAPTKATTPIETEGSAPATVPGLPTETRREDPLPPLDSEEISDSSVDVAGSLER